MTVSERQRLDLYERLGETLGRENAEVLMEYLPPVGWGDVARRHDIDAVRAELQAGDLALRLALEAGLAGIRQELHEQVSRLLMWVVGTMVACVGVVVAVVSSLS